MLRRALIALTLLTLTLVLLKSSHARDLGQWKYASPDISAYFAGLKQPDNGISCCGEADVYWADKTEECQPSDGPCALVAIITDTRDDAPLQRAHVAPGTRVVIPPNKVRKPPSPNPTEHNLIFLNVNGQPYCWEPLPLI